MNEIARKSIHISSSAIAAFVLLVPHNISATTLFIASISALLIDLIRIKNAKFSAIFNKVFKCVTREFESKSLLGSTYFLLGCTISTILFTQEIAFAAIMVLIICDTMACFAGKTIPSSKLVGEKSLSGFIGFFCSSVITLLVTSGTLNLNFTVFSIIIASLVSGLAELFSKQIKIDDNLLIPISCGLCLAIL